MKVQLCGATDGVDDLKGFDFHGFRCSLGGWQNIEVAHNHGDKKSEVIGRQAKPVSERLPVH
jgi:hypothetical protein